MNFLTYLLARRLGLLKSRHFSLPNALAGEEVVPELEQDQANAGRIAEESIAWLEDEERQASLRRKFSALHAELRKNAARSAADCVQSVLDQ